jgi:hypothetical protein
LRNVSLSLNIDGDDKKYIGNAKRSSNIFWCPFNYDVIFKIIIKFKIIIIVFQSIGNFKMSASSIQLGQKHYQ